ncbi:alpha/beta hydrolase [Roseibium sp.]|uniref:alpha/beta hydrolase n=1 Tax=Roseibium sp. TaxID=1936156 RepID=UPI003B52B0D4
MKFGWMKGTLLLAGMMLVVLMKPVAATETLDPFSIPATATHKITSEQLQRSYDIYVKTPVGYDDKANAGKVYPVIYLNDGPYTFQVASGVTHLPMGRSHKFDRAILVGISYAQGENGMASRVRDLTPVEDKRWRKYQTGGGEAYLRFLEEEVIPLVESTYRVDPAKRTLVGHSLGGSFGAWVLLKRPELFANYILTSPSLWFKDKFIFDLERETAAKRRDLKAKVYFAIGSRETKADSSNYPMVSQLKDFAAILESRDLPGLELKTEIIPDALHETTFPLAFTRASQWIFGRK